MNRKDLPLIISLVALLLAWPMVDRALIKPLFGDAPPPAPTASAPTPGVPDAALSAASESAPAPAATPVAAPVAAPAAEPAVALPAAEPPAEGPEALATLTNAVMEVTFTARGGAVRNVRLKNYRQRVAEDSPPVELDFTGAPALSLAQPAGLGERHDFEMEVAADGRSVRFARRTAAGLTLLRTVEMGDNYLLRVQDDWRNDGAAEADLQAVTIRAGPMRNLPGDSTTKGLVHLGVDTLPAGGGKIKYWSRKIFDLFKADQKARGAAAPAVALAHPLPEAGAVDWVGVKNKYFVQLLRPDSEAEGVTLHARRLAAPDEGQPGARGGAQLDEVAAELTLSGGRLAPGARWSKSFEYYVGPKKYSELSRLAYHQVEVMEFGMWGFIGKLLLQTLNGIYRVLPNYGVAIMLLTVLIRIIFWPITHKSTQSMKKMQELQPQVAALRAKYKDQPQRLNKEMMELYKENKVNPLGGCLPMLVQIPVFIALFVVLRSAIELRFAPFLWIRDLSEPENLLPGLLPFGLSLNLLPLLMTATQIWQQKLTPTAGDPSQQKMMLFMPVIMLVFFYNFASGLVLYWTVSQVLMIVQMSSQRWRVRHPHTAKPG